MDAVWIYCLQQLYGRNLVQSDKKTDVCNWIQTVLAVMK